MTDLETRIAERFESWWKRHPIHRQGIDDGLLVSIYGIAEQAWKASAGLIPKDHADERLDRLERRASFLETRIFNNRPNDSAHDKAELSALDWAMGIVRQATERTPSSTDV